ncbi:MFS transporter [Marinimicrobium sp. ARAG 43.8]|uniref:MFS transporter n=1 Tax=Marinimicrobium sp. ARAG 43.8 TaxID=3418719 RepID=UPI003CEBC0FA
MSAPEQPHKPRKKGTILALIFISVVINYMDRTNISVAASAMSEDLGLSTVQMGILFSAFAWTYSVMQIPGGMVVDLVKTRILYPFILVAWSMATLIQGLVSSMAALVGCRMAIGFFEAPSYPANNKIVTRWFPVEQRASAIAIYTSGQFIGLAFLMPVLAFIQDLFGWRGLFIVSALIGFVWAAVWFFVYRDPDEKPREAGEKPPVAEPQAGLSWYNLKVAFSNRKLWGVYIGQFCLGGTLIFFLTWFPTYLKEYRGYDTLNTGFLASVPFLAAFCGVLLSGFFSDLMVRKGFSNEVARKAPIIVGLLLSSSVMGANYATSTFWVTFFLSLTFFGNGLASINWVFVSLLAPKNMVGLVGGCFNFIGALSAVTVPVAIGFLAREGDFRPALFLVTGLAVVGLLSYLFLVGKVERIRLQPKLSEESTS